MDKYQQAILLLEHIETECEKEKDAIKLAIYCLEKESILRAKIIEVLREFVKE